MEAFSLAYRRRMFKRRPASVRLEREVASRLVFNLEDFETTKAKKSDPLYRAPPALPLVEHHLRNIFIFFVNFLSITKLMLANKKFTSRPRGPQGMGGAWGGLGGAWGG
uniref:Uncharacterized protein n=1 Tax=Pleurozia purpurea TaxID=280637 RepID=D0R004_9MARC|nr:hypothetical protein PlpuMp04 [Pleurozia purpurea]ACR19341.1 hypothetical protein PlpuMp04 [Pleurozia purpurea]